MVGPIRSIAALQVETQGLKVQHDQEMEILLRQWHAEKAARTKQLKRAETEARDLAARHENEKTAFVGELDRVREGQSTLLMHWQTEVAALVSLLVMDAESSAAVCGGNVPEADDAVHAVRELQRALGVSPSDLQDGAEIEAAAVRADEVHLALKATQAATEARREALEAFWGEQGGAKAAIDLEAVQAEAAELRDRLTTSEAEAEEALRGLQDLQSRWEADLKAARAEASAASMGLRVAEKERNRLKEDMAAAASKQQRLEAALDQEREALVRCWQVRETSRGLMEGQKEPANAKGCFSVLAGLHRRYLAPSVILWRSFLSESLPESRYAVWAMFCLRLSGIISPCLPGRACGPGAPVGCSAAPGKGAASRV